MTGLLAAAGIQLACLMLIPLCGWWLAMRLRGDSLVRFTAACFAGITTIAMAEMVTYVFHLPHLVILPLLAIAVAASARNLLATIQSRKFAWDGLLAWGGTSALLSAAAMYFATQAIEGQVWDWYEHWLRSVVFLKQAPVTTVYAYYIMPARGPLFNAAAAFFLFLAGSKHYWIFQIVAITFNVLMLLPSALLIQAISGLSRAKSILIASGLMLLLPFFFWNNTFTWTKDLTAAFVLMGIYAYLVALRDHSPTGMAASLAWLAPGFLVHYLTLIYGGILGLHLLYVCRNRIPWSALLRTTVIWGVLVGPWFAYMFLSFGVKQTLGANTTVGSYYASRDEHGRLVPYSRIFLSNACANLLPGRACRIITPPEKPEPCEMALQGSTTTPIPGNCHEPVNNTGVYRFLGVSGVLVMILAAIGYARGARLKDPGFLLWLAGAGLLINMLPIRWFDRLGTFHENLHAWGVIVVALAIPGLLRLPRTIVAVAVLAVVAEYAVTDIGILRGEATPLPLPHHASALRGDPPLDPWVVPMPQAAAPFQTPFMYYRNYEIKIRGGAVFFRDLYPDQFQIAAWVLAAIGLLALAGATRIRTES